MRIWFGVVLLCAVCAAQSLPDAPSATEGSGAPNAAQATLCIGQTCGWKQVKTIPPAPVTFWTFRGKYTDPPLRTNRQAFDKKFILLHAMAWASVIVACKRKNSGEDFGSEIPAIAGVTALDYMSTRLFSESFSVPPALYATAHYIWSATK